MVNRLQAITTKEQRVKRKNMLTNDSFSEKLLELSSLRTPFLKSDSYCDVVTKAHACLIQCSNNDILFDLRNYSYKFIFGHNHPLVIRYQEEIRSYLDAFKNKDCTVKNYFEEQFYEDLFKDNITFTLFGNVYELPSTEAYTGEFKRLINYFETAFLKCGRLREIQEMIKDIKSEIIQVKGNSVNIKKSNISKSDCYRNFLYINDDNFSDNELNLYIPITVTDDQLELLLKKIKDLIKG